MAKIGYSFVALARNSLLVDIYSCRELSCVFVEDISTKSCCSEIVGRTAQISGFAQLIYFTNINSALHISIYLTLVPSNLSRIVTKAKVRS